MTPKPCLGCGKVIKGGTYCITCARVKGKTRSARPHYQGDYDRRAKATRQLPVPCWICGEWDRPGDPWQADHVIASDPASPLRRAHRTCNASRGAG